MVEPEADPAPAADAETSAEGGVSAEEEVKLSIISVLHVFIYKSAVSHLHF